MLDVDHDYLGCSVFTASPFHSHPLVARFPGGCDAGLTAGHVGTTDKINQKCGFVVEGFAECWRKWVGAGLPQRRGGGEGYEVLGLGTMREKLKVKGDAAWHPPALLLPI